MTPGRGDPCPSCGVSRSKSVAAHHDFLPPGTILDHRYLIGRQLGSGGFGVTYLGIDTRIELKVCIKEYLPRGLACRDRDNRGVVPIGSTEELHFGDGMRDFLLEGRRLAKLNDKQHVCKVLSYFEENQTSYLVIEFIEGDTLAELIQDYGGHLQEPEAKDFLLQMLDGLMEIHRSGIIHRDIKPTNVMVTRNGQVTLIDFGAARDVVRERSRAASIQVSHGYAPLEQYYHPTVGQGTWTDVYAAGATAYTMATGLVPPKAKDLARKTEHLLHPRDVLGDQISDSFAEAILGAMGLDPADRFPTALEFRQAVLSSTPQKHIQRRRPPKKGEPSNPPVVDLLPPPPPT